ncbi:transmembrane protein 26-like [Mercenaria mercenaria]|uniref:transmembrane protein 26-like n=1 Tax=Mercenaria mercenaria TaxID=6596 RepID=UPI00234F696F|nr:transmembrane protein 26-like [Mercenaria mercenaria]
MWNVRYEGDGYTLSEDDNNSQSSTYVIPWTDKVFRRSSNSVYNLPDERVVSDGELHDVRDDWELHDVRDVNDTDAYSWINVDDTPKLSSVKSVPVPSVYTDVYSTSSLKQNQSFRDGGEITTTTDRRNMDNDKKIKEFDTSLIYGNHCSIFLACLVRMMLIGHNVLIVWRVTVDYKDTMYWLFTVANFFLIFECVIVIIRNAGKEYSWWSPCLLIYIASTIPAVWLLQLNQYHNFTNADKETSSTSCSDNAKLTPAQQDLCKPDIDVWVIILAETLVIMILFSRWLLPRGKVSRDHLADLLLEFLAIASDIMELLAVLDEDQVRRDLKLTYTIMAVWSASLIQFIFIFMRRNRYRKVHNVEFLARYCGGNIVEVLAICMSIFLQDLPFLVLRLYIIIEVELITYSLIFFLLKNIVTLLFLFYRLTILCCCQDCKGKPA